MKLKNYSAEAFLSILVSAVLCALCAIDKSLTRIATTIWIILICSIWSRR